MLNFRNAPRRLRPGMCCHWAINLHVSCQPSSLRPTCSSSPVVPASSMTTAFPASCPCFWPSGRPVILPQSHRGLDLMDGKQCLHLPMGPTVGSPENLAACILRLANDKTLRIRLGQNGRAFASQHFDWDASAARVYDFYRQLLASSRHEQTS